MHSVRLSSVQILVLGSKHLLLFWRDSQTFARSRSVCWKRCLIFYHIFFRDYNMWIFTRNKAEEWQINCRLLNVQFLVFILHRFYKKCHSCKFHLIVKFLKCLLTSQSPVILEIKLQSNQLQRCTYFYLTKKNFLRHDHRLLFFFDSVCPPHIWLWTCLLVMWWSQFHQ